VRDAARGDFGKRAVPDDLGECATVRVWEPAVRGDFGGARDGRTVGAGGLG
jgi:hypothetical protein